MKVKNRNKHKSKKNVRANAAGIQGACAVRVLDVGTQPSTYRGQTSLQRKFAVHFETSNGLVFVKFYTASLHPNSSLRKDLEQWNGRPLSDTEIEDFDTSWFLGRYCRLNIVNHKSKNGNRQKIDGIMPWHSDCAHFRTTRKLMQFDIDNPNKEAFMSMPHGAHRMLLESPEWKQHPFSNAWNKEHALWNYPD